MVSGVVFPSPGADIGRQKILKYKKKKNDLEDFRGRMRKKMTYSRVTWGYDFPVKGVKFPKILKYRDTSNKYLPYLEHRKNAVRMVFGVVFPSPGADIGRQKIVK